MLKQPDGKPYLAGNFDGAHYYILDFTQPEVAKVLSDLVRKFIRRYKPDLFKFDFGYELPAMGIAAPKDKNWTGERLMWKGLEVVIKAMREEKPDLVVMYYQLSPLFLDYFDLHSTDDMFLAAGEYDLEANRRIYFSSLLGPLGIPTYGSSGYDWASAPHIWFDSAAVGTIGSLNDFKADEEAEGATPELVAKYNGVAKVLRSTTTFEVLPFGTVSQAPTYRSARPLVGQNGRWRTGSAGVQASYARGKKSSHVPGNGPPRKGCCPVHRTRHYCFPRQQGHNTKQQTGDRVL